MSAGANIPPLPRVLSFVLLLASSVATAQEAADTPTPLPLERSLGIATHVKQPVTYALEATAGETYLLEVGQGGLDFIVTVDAPGSEPQTYNSPLQRDEPEFVVIDAANDGTHLITINSDEPTDAQGSYTIRARTYEDLHLDDPRYLAAWRAMSNAAAAHASGDRQSMEHARDLYVAAGTLWEALGETRLQAQALYSAGMLEYWQLENWSRTVAPDGMVQPGAVEYADRAAALYRALGERALYANAIFLRAYARIETANGVAEAERPAVFDTALASFRETLDIHTSLGNDFEIASVLNFTGITHWYRADGGSRDFEAARSYYDQSAAIFSTLGEWRQELQALQNIVVLDYAQGKSLQAIQSFERILDRLPTGRDVALRASILSNLGISHLAFGNVDESLLAHNEAWSLYRSIDDATGQGYALKNIGQTYFAFGDFDSAVRYLEQADALAQQTNDFRTRAAIQSVLGNVSFARRDHEGALASHRRAVELSSSAEEKAQRQLLVAKDLAALGRHDEAIGEAQLARTQSRSEQTQADALLQLAVSHIAGGEIARATSYLDEASSLYRALSLEGRLGDVSHAYALAARAGGDLHAAVEYGRDALQRIEELRERVAHPELRALNGAARRTYYESQIDILMQLHEETGEDVSEYLYEALSVSERSRARMTMDLLGEAAVDLVHDMEPAVVEERAGLYASLAEKRQLQERASAGQEAAQLSAEMDEIENRLNLLETEHRRAHPDYVGFAAPRIRSAGDIQAYLDSDSVLLQYALGEKRSFLWAVTAEAVRVAELGGRQSIEALARSIHGDLGAPPYSRRERRIDQDMMQLSNEVLTQVADLLQTKTRVLVAADGALQYVPFGALPVAVAGKSAVVPLIAAREDREVINVASVSVDAAMTERDSDENASGGLAVFADPVFSAADSRFSGNETAEHSAITDNAVSMTRAASGPSLPRLPYTGREAAQIAALAEGMQNRVALGFEANLDAVLDEDLRRYRYIHFATHGLVDSEHPALSALALSRFDDRGRPRPGFLRLHDIYGLDLNADVVVLSACDTGLGREIKGEALVGLAQGFISAGAQNVIASLWQVPDRSTADLMTQFYGRLLREKVSPARALADAQRAMLRESRSSDPYFWGAFVIQGDARRLQPYRER